MFIMNTHFWENGKYIKNPFDTQMISNKKYIYCGDARERGGIINFYDCCCFGIFYLYFCNGKQFKTIYRLNKILFPHSI